MAEHEPTPDGHDDHDGQAQLLDVLGVLRHLTDVVTATGPDHVDPAAAVLAEPIHCQVADPDLHIGRIRLTDGTTPVCIVGRVLHAAGVPVAQLARLDELARDAQRPSSVIEHAEIPGMALTPAARQLLAEAQHDQDLATPWGEVLELALATADDHDLLAGHDPDQVEQLRDDATSAVLPTGIKRALEQERTADSDDDPRAGAS